MTTPDIVLGLEGINEPNTNRKGWAQRTVDIQRAIWEARNNHRALDGVKVISPSLHDRNEDVSDGAGYRALRRKGIGELCDVAGLHSYPKGRRITFALADRLKLVDIAYKGKPVWVTEFGWTNYSGGSGQRPTSEARAAEAGRSGDPEDRRAPAGAQGVPLRADRRPPPREALPPRVLTTAWSARTGRASPSTARYGGSSTVADQERRAEGPAGHSSEAPWVRRP